MECEGCLYVRHLALGGFVTLLVCLLHGQGSPWALRECFCVMKSFDENSVILKRKTDVIALFQKLAVRMTLLFSASA